MPMQAEEIEAMIVKQLPGAEVEITDLAGDGDHYAAKVVWAGFEGMNRLARTRKVYDALDGRMGTDLHALQLSTALPD